MRTLPQPQLLARTHACPQAHRAGACQNADAQERKRGPGTPGREILGGGVPGPAKGLSGQLSNEFSGGVSPDEGQCVVGAGVGRGRGGEPEFTDTDTGTVALTPTL